jgi:hypothetical protein
MKTMLACVLALTLLVGTAISQQWDDCPAGSQTYETVVSIRYGCDTNSTSTSPQFECPFRVQYCCWWDAAQQKLIVRLLYVAIPRFICFEQLIDCKGWGFFWKELSALVLNHALNSCYTDLPPCTDPSSFRYEFRYPTCMKYVNIYMRYASEWDLRLIECSINPGVVCYRITQVCRDFSVSPPDIVTRLIETGVMGTSNCLTEQPEVPPPGKNWLQPWETECFLQPCGF